MSARATSGRQPLCHSTWCERERNANHETGSPPVLMRARSASERPRTWRATAPRPRAHGGQQRTLRVQTRRVKQTSSVPLGAMGACSFELRDKSAAHALCMAVGALWSCVVAVVWLPRLAASRRRRRAAARTAASLSTAAVPRRRLSPCAVTLRCAGKAGGARSLLWPSAATSAAAVTRLSTSRAALAALARRSLRSLGARYARSTLAALARRSLRSLGARCRSASF